MSNNEMTLMEVVTSAWQGERLTKRLRVVPSQQIKFVDAIRHHARGNSLESTARYMMQINRTMTPCGDMTAAIKAVQRVL